ncbi:unnamed protein product [Symbiodinium sp. CCMP2592]|nr:unnamed protein product [Symbiodinium sp. CCMP2592]
MGSAGTVSWRKLQRLHDLCGQLALRRGADYDMSKFDALKKKVGEIVQCGDKTTQVDADRLRVLHDLLKRVAVLPAGHGVETEDATSPASLPDGGGVQDACRRDCMELELQGGTHLAKTASTVPTAGPTYCSSPGTVSWRKLQRLHDLCGQLALRRGADYDMSKFDALKKKVGDIVQCGDKTTQVDADRLRVLHDLLKRVAALPAVSFCDGGLLMQSLVAQ